MTGFDVIGDIHGHADTLIRLLADLGYRKKGGVYRHEGRTAVFLGDFVDRGPHQREALRIARSMVEAGAARAVMGNHEFNAIGFATPDGDGGHLRPRTEKNRHQHRAFLDQIGDGSAVGALNGFFIVVFRIHSLIVTLGIGTFLHGVGLWASDSQTISGVAPALSDFVIVRRLFGVPLVFYYAIALAALVWYVFEFTAVGRRILFVGRGREVARLSGVHTDRLRWLCLVASGLFGSLAGVLYTGTLGAADPVSGDSHLLPALAAAFLGSTSILPGRFNPWGSTVAVYFLVTGITGLIFLGFGSFIQDMFYGGALVLAVALSQIVRGRQEQSF